MKPLTTGDVARLVGVSQRTVSKWLDDNKLRGFRIPGSLHRRVPVDGLVEFLEANGIPVPEDLRPRGKQG